MQSDEWGIGVYSIFLRKENSVTRTQEEKKRLVSRIKRIEGQMKTLEKMVDRDAPCVEVMRLINSASGALKGLLTKIVTDHLNGCISAAMDKRDAKLVDELADFFKTLR